jgi:hypothetical protein
MAGKFEAKFLDIIASIEFSELSEYLQIVEKQLSKAVIDIEEEYTNKTAGWVDDDFADNDEYDQEETYKLTGTFPRMARSSYLVLCFSIFENRIDDLCEHIKTVKNIPISINDLRGDLLDRFKKYIRLAGFPISFGTASWNELNRYYKLRNCIVHDNGHLEALKHDSDMMHYIESKAIKSDDTIRDLLVLSPEFCAEVANTMKKIYKEVCKSVYYATHS